MKRKNWYKKGGNESVLFVTATPNSELKELLQKEISKSKFKIKVIEKSGKKIVRLLQKNNPFGKKGCGKKDCMICRENGGGSCRETGITYSIDCMGVPERGIRTNTDAGEQHVIEGARATCEAEGVYNGETGRNGYTRGKKHIEDYENELEGSAMWKHCIQHHGSERQRFRMQVRDRVRNDATKRQIMEAVRIGRVRDEQRMNSRGEWGSNRIPRIEVTRD